jgi:hypothetical protein
MPEETAAPTPSPAEAPDGAAPSSTAENAPVEGQESEKPDPNSWIRQSATGLLYSRPLDTASKSKEWDEANAELRRGRRNGTEETRQESTDGDTDGNRGGEQAAGDDEQKASEETDDRAFERRVQAEVDRREALRAHRARSQQERELRQKDPTAYARLKEQEEQSTTAGAALTNALSALSGQFDDATVKPLMDALPEKTRSTILGKAVGVHGIPQRKLLVEEGLKAYKQVAYDEGYAKGKAEAEKALRRPTSSLRKELLAELRGAEDEPDLAPGNGVSSSSDDWNPNDWMRASLGKGARSRSVSS